MKNHRGLGLDWTCTSPVPARARCWAMPCGLAWTIGSPKSLQAEIQFFFGLDFFIYLLDWIPSQASSKARRSIQQLPLPTSAHHGHMKTLSMRRFRRKRRQQENFIPLHLHYSLFLFFIIFLLHFRPQDNTLEIRWYYFNLNLVKLHSNLVTMLINIDQLR